MFPFGVALTDVDVDLVLLVGIHDGCMARERASQERVVWYTLAGFNVVDDG